MDFKLIETFLMVSKTTNITEAAEILYVSQSTISHRLKSLETNLGIKLIDRDRGFKKVKLTAGGEAFLKIAYEWQNLHNKTMQFSSEPIKQTFSIASLNSINSFLFDEVYKEILNDPTIQLEIKTEHTDEIYDHVMSRTIDVGFVTQYIPYPQIYHEKLIDEKMVLVTKNEKYMNLQDPSELNPENQIYFDWGDNYIKWHNKFFSHESKPKLLIDLQLLGFEMLDHESWLIAPLSVANSLKDKFDHLYVVSLAKDAPTRTVFMLNHKNPMDSSKKVIERVRTLIEPCINKLI